MANYGFTPNIPRPLSKVHVGVAPGRDARWRSVNKRTKRIDILERMERERKARRKSV